MELIVVIIMFVILSIFVYNITQCPNCKSHLIYKELDNFKCLDCDFVFNKD